MEPLGALEVEKLTKVETILWNTLYVKICKKVSMKAQWVMGNEFLINELWVSYLQGLQGQPLYNNFVRLWRKQVIKRNKLGLSCAKLSKA